MVVTAIHPNYATVAFLRKSHNSLMSFYRAKMILIQAVESTKLMPTQHFRDQIHSSFIRALTNSVDGTLGWRVTRELCREDIACGRAHRGVRPRCRRRSGGLNKACQAGTHGAHQPKLTSEEILLAVRVYAESIIPAHTDSGGQQTQRQVVDLVALQRSPNCPFTPVGQRAVGGDNFGELALSRLRSGFSQQTDSPAGRCRSTVPFTRQPLAHRLG